MVGIDMSWVWAGQKRSELLVFDLDRVRAELETNRVVEFGLGYVGMVGFGLKRTGVVAVGQIWSKMCRDRPDSLVGWKLVKNLSFCLGRARDVPHG